MYPFDPHSKQGIPIVRGVVVNTSGGDIPRMISQDLYTRLVEALTHGRSRLGQRIRMYESRRLYVLLKGHPPFIEPISLGNIVPC